MTIRRYSNHLVLTLALILGGMSIADSRAGQVHEIDQITDVSALSPDKVYRFSPTYLWIEPGDTVRFLNSVGQHTVKSIEGMYPEGAQPADISHAPTYDITLTVPGVYGFKCKVHNRHGMFALVVVGDPSANLEEAKKARVNDRGKAMFKELFVRAEREWAERRKN